MLNKKIDTINMCCDICKKNGHVQYRVSNTQSKNWIFSCENCLQDFHKTEGYKYGGTRKANRRIRQ